MSTDHHEPGGAFARMCPECGIIFRTDNPRTKYCGKKCYARVCNRTWYYRHREARKAQVREYMRKKRKQQGS